uniref:ATP synthase F0 subunit 6 n=1 Tax=Dactylogyrus simplex TaxID=2736736 RepID=UPI002E7712BC|nr:ATP synthase F0 subunit 6 [Dactylogyrus simplex]WPS93117.1 ATP synthase F0 subunit 6 [Dactylogyrus simplex]
MLGVSRVNLILSGLSTLVKGLSPAYNFICIMLLCIFLTLRVPYIYSAFGFLSFIFIAISPLFLSLFVSRFNNGFNIFFASLVPPATPLWIAPFVGLAETISYIVRPAVLMIRPFLNITIGSLGAAACAGYVAPYPPLLALSAFLFFYEVFVAMVHWFIVVNILGFSVDH